MILVIKYSWTLRASGACYSGTQLLFRVEGFTDEIFTGSKWMNLLGSVLPPNALDHFHLIVKLQLYCLNGPLSDSLTGKQCWKVGMGSEIMSFRYFEIQGTLTTINFLVKLQQFIKSICNFLSEPCCSLYILYLTNWNRIDDLVIIPFQWIWVELIFVGQKSRDSTLTFDSFLHNLLQVNSFWLCMSCFGRKVLYTVADRCFDHFVQKCFVTCMYCITDTASVRLIREHRFF